MNYILYVDDQTTKTHIYDKNIIKIASTVT